LGLDTSAPNYMLAWTSPCPTPSWARTRQWSPPCWTLSHPCPTPYWVWT
jgi:hypothetical protein